MTAASASERCASACYFCAAAHRHTFKSQLKAETRKHPLCCTTHSHKCHTHVKIAYIKICSYGSCIVHHYQSHPSAARAHLTRSNISHASRTHLARISRGPTSLPSHLISPPSRGRPSRAAVATNNPYRYPLFLKRPKPGRRSPAPPRTRGPAPSDNLYGRPWLCLCASLPACLPACLRSHLWPTALRSRSGTHCVVQRPQPLQLRLQLRLVGALEVVERRLGRVR